MGKQKKLSPVAINTCMGDMKPQQSHQLGMHMVVTCKKPLPPVATNTCMGDMKPH